MNDALGCGVGTQVESQSRVHIMLKSFCLMSAIAVGTLLSLPLTASAMTLGPSGVIAGSAGSHVQTVRMRSMMHRGRHRSMRRGRMMRPSGGHSGGTSTSSGAAGGAR
jgi:hypothetical protein